MADIFVAAGGSGGASSDETTARAADVLSGKTYLGADTSDDVGAGAMPDNGAMRKTLRAGESVAVPRGYHHGSGAVTAAPLAEQTPGHAARVPEKRPLRHTGGKSAGRCGRESGRT